MSVLNALGVWEIDEDIPLIKLPKPLSKEEKEKFISKSVKYTVILYAHEDGRILYESLEKSPQFP